MTTDLQGFPPTAPIPQSARFFGAASPSDALPSVFTFVEVLKAIGSAARQFRPADFGAKGDGVTDDRAALNAVFAASESAGGGVVAFDPGAVHFITGPVTVSSNTVIQGNFAQLKCPDAGWEHGRDQNAPMLLFDSVENTAVLNLKHYGTKSQDLTHTPFAHLYIGTCHNILVMGSVFEHSAFEACWGYGDHTHCAWVANYFENVGYPAPGYGALPALQISAASSVVALNRFYDVGTGIGASGDDALVVGNYVEEYRGVGISSGDGNVQTGVLVTGNRLITHGYSGYFSKGLYADKSVLGPSNGVAFIANEVTLIGEAGVGTLVAMMNSAQCEHATFKQNVITIDTAGTATYLQGTTAGTTVVLEGNDITMVNVSANCRGFSGNPNGSGKTLTILSRNNNVWGATRAASAYAIFFHLSGGGTFKGQFANDYVDGGYISLANVGLNDNGEYDGRFFSYRAANTIASGATPALDCSLGPVHAFTATAASTFGAPSKIPAAGEAVTVIITQDGTGGWAISWNAAYVFPSAWSNTGNMAGKKSVARFVSDGSKLIAQGANVWY